MREVDLDAARAARAEARGEAPTVKFGGKRFTLPAELPFAIVESVRDLSKAQDDDDGLRASEIVSDIARALFGDQYSEFLAMGPSMADVQALLEGIAPAYGLKSGLGESSASEN